MIIKFEQYINGKWSFCSSNKVLQKGYKTRIAKPLAKLFEVEKTKPIKKSLIGARKTKASLDQEYDNIIEGLHRNSLD